MCILLVHELVFCCPICSSQRVENGKFEETKYPNLLGLVLADGHERWREEPGTTFWARIRDPDLHSSNSSRLVIKRNAFNISDWYIYLVYSD